MEIKKDDVLVPKFGQEKQFYKALSEMSKVATGTLGWKGQAEMMIDLDLTKALEVKLKGNKEEKTKQMIEHLQQSFLSSIYEHGEWVSKEEANKRKISRKVLYGK